MTSEERKEALAYFEKEEAKMREYRDYFHNKGDKGTPNLDRKIRVLRAAILALTEPITRTLPPPPPSGHTCVVLGPCDGNCWGGAKK
jgi:hypothetical protein